MYMLMAIHKFRYRYVVDYADTSCIHIHTAMLPWQTNLLVVVVVVLVVVVVTVLGMDVVVPVINWVIMNKSNS